jgi:hypothetical protein
MAKRKDRLLRKTAMGISTKSSMTTTRSNRGMAVTISSIIKNMVQT